QWPLRDLKDGSDSSKLGLRNGVSVSRIDNQELKSLNHSQVNNLLYGTVGSTLEMQLGNNATPISLVRNKKIEADIEPILIHNQQVLVLKVHVFQQDTAN
ncbi:MAG TPA: peptidase S41, partial [Acinetobacter radioresistens]|nr:peptidase S41 [Acinetobacter radioresistens]